VLYQDGPTELFTRTIGVSSNGDKSVLITFDEKNTVSKLILGTSYDADVDAINNLWRSLLRFN